MDQPIFFVDFEGNRASGVLEFGVVTVYRGEITEARTRLCRPIGRIAEQDTALHGLEETQLLSEAPFADEWDYFADLRECGPLGAHYAGVENALLKSVWPYPRNSPNFARAGESLIDWGPWIDSARIYAQLFPQFATGQLEKLVNLVGLQGELDRRAHQHCPPDRRHYHAALYDALAGALLLTALSRDDQLSDLSMMQLMALSTLDGRKRDALAQDELF